jgi:hypothetical protein
VPESIRNAIVLAFIAVLVSLVGVGLLLWSQRPAAPPTRPATSLPLLVNDPSGGVYDLSVKFQQMEQRLGETQVLSQKLMEQLRTDVDERGQLVNRLTGLEKEVRRLRMRLQQAEQRLPAPAVPKQPASTSTPPGAMSPPAATSTPSGAQIPAAPPP